MPEFLKPELPRRVAELKQQACRRRASASATGATATATAADDEKKKKEETAHLKLGEKLVVRTKMPNTPAFWSDLMLGNAAFKSYDDNFRLTCLSAQQQRAKNDVPRQLKKVHWDYVLDEAEWLRRDFREERGWKMGEAKKRAEECLAVWNVKVKERGRFVMEVDEVTGFGLWSGLGYRRGGGHNEVLGWGREFAVRTRGSGDDARDEVLGKRKWKAASDGGEGVQDRLKRPRTLRRFSCHADDSI